MVVASETCCLVKGKLLAVNSAENGKLPVNGKFFSSRWRSAQNVYITLWKMYYFLFFTLMYNYVCAQTNKF